jgi:hypothetical protein
MQLNLKDGKTTWKQEWAEIGGKRNFYRSRWEYRYALYLQLMKDNKDIHRAQRQQHQICKNVGKNQGQVQCCCDSQRRKSEHAS